MTKDRKKQIKINDDLCREICRIRDKVCVHCGRPPKDGRQMDWTHFITRGNHHTRWNADNSFMSHSGCHSNFFHKHPEKFVDFMQQRLGDRYWLLRKAANDTSKLDLKAIEFCLRQKLGENSLGSVKNHREGVV